MAGKDDTGGKWQGKMILEGIVAGREAEASHNKDGRRTLQMSSER